MLNHSNLHIILMHVLYFLESTKMIIYDTNLEGKENSCLDTNFDKVPYASDGVLYGFFHII